MWQLAICAGSIGLSAVLYTYIRTRLSQSTDSVYHNQVFVVPDFAWTLGISIIAIFLGGLLWAQSKWASPLWPRLQKAAVWLFALGFFGPLIGVTAFEVGLARNIDHSSTMQTINQIAEAATLLTWVAIAALTILPVTALVTRR